MPVHDLAPPVHPVGIRPHHDVQMIAHHRVGQHIHRKRPRRLPQEIAHPRAPVFGRVPTKKRPAYAARDQMERTTTGIIDQQSAGEGHAGEYMVLTDLSRVNLCLSTIPLISYYEAEG